MYYKNASGVIVVFDVTNHATYEASNKILT